MFVAACSQWRLTTLLSCELQVENTSRPDLGLFLIKYVMMLIVGIPSVFWVGSKKTCFEWASFFHGKRCKRYEHTRAHTRRQNFILYKQLRPSELQLSYLRSSLKPPADHRNRKCVWIPPAPAPPINPPLPLLLAAAPW